MNLFLYFNLVLSDYDLYIPSLYNTEYALNYNETNKIEYNKLKKTEIININVNYNEIKYFKLYFRNSTKNRLKLFKYNNIWNNVT